MAWSRVLTQHISSDEHRTLWPIMLMHLMHVKKKMHWGMGCCWPKVSVQSSGNNSQYCPDPLIKPLTAWLGSHCLNALDIVSATSTQQKSMFHSSRRDRLSVLYIMLKRKLGAHFFFFWGSRQDFHYTSHYRFHLDDSQLQLWDTKIIETCVYLFVCLFVNLSTVFTRFPFNTHVYIPIYELQIYYLISKSM